MTWPEVTGVSSAIQAHTAAPSPPNPDITNHTSWASAPRFTAIFSILILTSWIMMIHRIDELLYKSSKLLRYKRQMLYFEFTSSGTGVYPSSVLVDSLKTQYFVNVSDPSKRPWQHYVGCRSFRFRSLIATHSYCGIKPQIVPYQSASSLWEFSFRDMSYIIYLYGETLQRNLQKNSWIRIKLIWLLSQKKKRRCSYQPATNFATFHLGFASARAFVFRWVEGLGPLRFKGVWKLGPCQS